MNIDFRDREMCSDLILNLMGAGVEFNSVYVKTLKAHYDDVVMGMVSDQFDNILSEMHPDFEKYDRRVNEAITELERTQNVYVSPFIEIPKSDYEQMTVCLDVDSVDDNTWYHVILAITENECEGGTVNFGTPRCFNPRVNTPTHQLGVLSDPAQAFI